MKFLTALKGISLSNIMVVVLLVLLIFTCNRSPKSILVPGVTTEHYLNDSTKYYETVVALTQSKSQIAQLQDSLERAVSKASHTKPTGIIRVKEDINYDSLYIAFTGNLRDSLEKYKNLPKDSFNSQVLMPYVYEDNWLKQKGRILGGGISIDSLKVTTKQHILISESKGLFKPKKLLVEMINENPKVSYSEQQIYQYQPKVRKWGLVVGPTATFNGRNMEYGIGATLGFKIL